MPLAPSTLLPTTLQTPRLTLRLADPSNDLDCQQLIAIYTDPHASLGGNARVGINTPADVRAKHEKHGPRQELCTRAEAPRGMFHLVYLKDSGPGGEKCVGMIALSFREEMPYPDLGYALFHDYWGRGYAPEAGREVLKFWTETVGVKEVFAGALEGNERSLKCAERIGFVRAGVFDVEFGAEGEDGKRVRAVAMVLPGMRWRDVDERGERIVIRPTVGVETEAQRRDVLRVD